MRRAFTLIELLIVVAIIAILAAIALPNFLEAQTRAKVSRTRNDLRSLATAVEAYRIDQNRYPLPAAVMASDGSVRYPMPGPMHSMYTHNFLAHPVTTPVAYVTALPADVFMAGDAAPMPENRFYYYQSFEYTWLLAARAGVAPAAAMEVRYDAFGEWVMFACGPDGDRKDAAPSKIGPIELQNAVYDPSNGTVSNGDVIRTQRNPSGIAL